MNVQKTQSPATKRMGRAAPPGALHPTRSFVLIVGAAFLLCAFIEIPSLYYSHEERDERVFWQLALNLVEKGQYNLQGTELLTQLSPQMYDHPIFNHPPLFPALLVPFAALGSQRAAVLVPWIGHMLAVMGVALLARHALRGTADADNFTAPIFWMPILGVATDPLLVFVSRKLWMDGVLAGLLALSVAVVLVGEGNRRRLVLAGILVGLAGLGKLSVLIIAPVFLIPIFRHDRTWRARFSSMVAFGAPVAALVVPWLLIYHAYTGVFVPTWMKPDAWSLEHYDFMKAIIERPWYYYLVKLPLLSPLVVVALWAVLRDRTMWRDIRVQVVMAWLAIVLGGLTYLSAGGFGFQMRHVTQAAAAVYFLVPLGLMHRNRPALLVVSAFAIFIGTVTGAMFLLNPQFDEIVSFAEIASIVRF